MFTKDNNGFIVYKPTKDDIAETKKLFERRFSKSLSINEKTVYNRIESRMAGILGEIVFQKYVGIHGALPDREDLVYDILVNKAKVDVKCKFRAVVPRPEFEASFFTYQAAKHFSTTEYYVFMSTIKGYETVWICGYLPKKDWLKNEHGKLWKRGDIDPTNGKQFDEDTWSVMYKYLNKLEINFTNFENKEKYGV